MAVMLTPSSLGKGEHILRQNSTQLTTQNFHLPRWKLHHELGITSSPLSRYNQTGDLVTMQRHLYGHLRQCHAFHPRRTVNHTGHGGIFNFDFSTDGSILVAACEGKSFLLFDPFNGRLIGSKTNAHDDCVNHIRFLDSRLFASCSDDTTVRLWDTRYLKHCIRTLEGHSNWVKNIEYDRCRGLLLTSGFDGSVYSWDINNFSENGSVCKRVFHTSGLMRTKLTPDASKLIISTAGGYLMIVHDLDLTTLADDLRGFKPNMYRMMQMSQSPIRNGYKYNQLFRGKRNRVEFATDFPEGNDAEVISSLQVHPQGWAVVTRNNSSDENSEWTCLHDIQSYPADQGFAGEDDTDYEEDSAPYSEPNSANHSRSASPSFFLYIAVDDDASSSAPSPSNPRSPAVAPVPPDPVLVHPDWVQQQQAGSDDVINPEMRIPEIVNPEDGIPDDGIGDSNRGHNDDTSRRPNTFAYITNTRHESSYLHLLQPSAHNKHKSVKIYDNRPRLQYYVEEPNVGRGFIKVMCFSNDGRVVCSPFGYGARILALDERCSELCDVYSDVPKVFKEVQSCSSHKNVVLCTKFSPTHCLYVSGCLSGDVMFHQPVL